MDALSIKVRRLRPEAVLPVRATDASAGADLRAVLDGELTVAPGETVFVPTGLSLERPDGYAGFVFARSGLSCKRGLAPANKVGVIDADYRGEVLVALLNHGREPVTVAPGERIAQLVVMPVARTVFVEAETLSDTARGAGGFGSTGR